MLPPCGCCSTPTTSPGPNDSQLAGKPSGPTPLGGAHGTGNRHPALPHQRLSDLRSSSPSGASTTRAGKTPANCIVRSPWQAAPGPIALCEVQGYVYARQGKTGPDCPPEKRLDLAEQWEGEANLLEGSGSTRTSGCPTWHFLAPMALDGRGTTLGMALARIPAIVWAWAFSPEKRPKAWQSSDGSGICFNGWGIRTLSSDSPA